MIIPSLPFDVVSEIIDHLHDDKKSLLACVLVTSSWVDLARYHLFYRLKVLVETPDWLSSLLSVVENTAKIAGYVRELFLWGRQPAFDDNVICYHHLGLILAKLPNLNKALSFHGIHFLCNHSGHHPDINIDPRNMNTISINHCVAQRGPTLPFLLSYFSHVGRLSTQHFYGPRSHTLAPSALPALEHLHVHSLDLHTFRNDDLIQALRASPESFSIYIHSAGQLDRFKKFVQRFGPELRQVTLRPVSYCFLLGDIASEDFSDINFTSCNQLQVLEISTYAKYDPYLAGDEEEGAIWRSIIHILASTPTTLPTVHLDFTVDGESREYFERVFLWEMMDRALDQIRGLRLLVFTVQVDRTELDDDVQVYTQMIQRGLPRTHERGVLRIELNVESWVPQHRR